MCIYTLKNQRFKNNSSRGVRDSAERLKIRRLNTQIIRGIQWQQNEYVVYNGSKTCF